MLRIMVLGLVLGLSACYSGETYVETESQVSPTEVKQEIPDDKKWEEKGIFQALKDAFKDMLKDDE